uniref:Chromo domain-containing protein n=1 Tax=Peronospora matthiolae TaxID=2874970 RepID=A0AAV1V220_9STRA
MSRRATASSSRKERVERSFSSFANANAARSSERSCDKEFNYLLQDPQALNAESVREPGHFAAVPLHGSALDHQANPTLEPDQVFPPPPHPLVDSSGGQRFLVERILSQRDVKGVRTSYLVRWRGYPWAWDSWEPRAELIVDVLGLVEQYDETHPLRSKKGRRKTTSSNANTGIASFNPFGHLERDVRPPAGIIRKEVLPRGTVAFLKPDASCIKFGEPGLTANELDDIGEGVPSLHQGFSVSNTVAIVPPTFEKRIGEELFPSTDSFRAGIEGQILLQSNNGIRSRSVVMPANRSNCLDDGF